MRTFIAVDLPPEIRAKLGQIQEALKKCDLAAKWVNPANIHLTLKFLGEVKEEKIEEIKKAMEKTAGGISPLSVALKGFGFFPHQIKPRVFFVTTDKQKELRELASQLEENLAEIGFAPEGRFKSHLTLCRFKGLKNIDCLIEEIKNITLTESFAVGTLTLFKSTLTAGGPIYQELAKADLVR